MCKSTLGCKFDSTLLAQVELNITVHIRNDLNYIAILYHWNFIHHWCQMYVECLFSCFIAPIVVCVSQTMCDSQTSTTDQVDMPEVQQTEHIDVASLKSSPIVDIWIFFL